jgi:hypothetical protein
MKAETIFRAYQEAEAQKTRIAIYRGHESGVMVETDALSLQYQRRDRQARLF